MKMTLMDVQFEKVEISNCQIEFSSEESNFGIAVFTDGCIVSYWGSHEDDSYDEALINLNDEAVLTELFGLIKELSLNNQEVR